MDNKILKHLMIIVILVIIMLIILLTILNNKEIKEDVNDYISDNENVLLQQEESAYLIINESLYFSIKDNIMQKYVNYIAEKDTKAVYNMLSIDYIEDNNITIENILSQLPSYSVAKFIPQHMYMKEGEIADNVYIYAIIQDSIVTNSNLEVIENEMYYRLILDKQNATFAIEPISQEEYQQYIEGNQQENNVSIERNEYNIVKYSSVTEEYIAREHLNHFSNLLKNDTKRAYSVLNEEYKTLKYKSYVEFEEFIEENVLEGFNLLSYTKVYKDDDTIQYICEDEYRRKYIFEETAVMEYTVQLDDYTLDNETFNEEYAKSSNQDKAILNADKFFKMINNQDYTSAYALLDESFKQNYFKTQTQFETYMKQKIYRYNKVNYKTYSNEISSLHMIGLTLTDATGVKTEEIEFNIIIKLLEDTDFVMSFTVI